MIKIGTSKYGLISNSQVRELAELVFQNQEILVERVESYKDYDFILFDGGADVAPEFYKEKQHPQTEINFARDLLEKSIYLQFLNKHTKYLGICRGNQFLNVMSGGTLIQHLPDYNLMQDYMHKVFICPSTKLELYTEFNQCKYMQVNSTHHQAIKTLGENSTVTLIDEKGVIEGFETKDGKIRAVQCHPEYLDFKMAFTLLNYLFRV